jgi:hypothetical protein
MTFNKGDKVKVVKKVPKEDGWENGWTHVMDKAIGKEFTVAKVDEKCGVYFDERETVGYGFPQSSLEKVDLKISHHEYYAVGSEKFPTRGEAYDYVVKVKLQRLIGEEVANAVLANQKEIINVLSGIW